MELAQRSHYVIPDWRRPAERRAADVEHLVLLPQPRLRPHHGDFEDAKKKAQAAAMMTGTQRRHGHDARLGWSGHFSRPVAEDMYANIKRVGMPKWDDKDQVLAKGTQRELAPARRDFSKVDRGALDPAAARSRHGAPAADRMTSAT